MAELHPDKRACAAWLQIAVPLVPMPPHVVERLVAPPREHKPNPPCSEGGPHDYPPSGVTTDPHCSMCGRTPAANAVAGIRHAVAEHAVAEAFG